MVNSEWNTGRTADGLSLLVHEREWNVPLIKKVSKYDPTKGSSREYVWTDDANCAGMDPDLFQVAQLGDPGVPHMNGQGLREFNLKRLTEAAEYCVDCPVKQRCLKEATVTDRYWSVRGGELPERVAGERGARKRIPSFDMTGYGELWSCSKHGSMSKRTSSRIKEGKEYTITYCGECNKK